MLQKMTRTLAREYLFLRMSTVTKLQSRPVDMSKYTYLPRSLMQMISQSGGDCLLNSNAGISHTMMNESDGLAITCKSWEDSDSG
jgi:hypothetical protein